MAPAIWSRWRKPVVPAGPDQDHSDAHEQSGDQAEQAVFQQERGGGRRGHRGWALDDYWSPVHHGGVGFDVGLVLARDGGDQLDCSSGRRSPGLDAEDVVAHCAGGHDFLQLVEGDRGLRRFCRRRQHDAAGDNCDLGLGVGRGDVGARRRRGGQHELGGGAGLRNMEAGEDDPAQEAYHRQGDDDGPPAAQGAERGPQVQGLFSHGLASRCWPATAWV